jgi:hypothetical protein
MRRARIPVLALLTGLLLAAAPLVCAHAAQALWVAVDQAPLRVWRSAESEVALRLPRGTVVEPLYEEPPWVRVREPGGQEGWVYRGHLSDTAPPPSLAETFGPPPDTLILAEAASTSRSSRAIDLSGAGQPAATASARPNPAPDLRIMLDRTVAAEELEAFLNQGGVGEYAHIEPGVRDARAGRAAFPHVAPAAAPGGEPELQLGVCLAARVLSRMAPASPDTSLARYVTLVGSAVARHAPAQQHPFRAMVLDLPEPVSFSLPGGIVMVSTGLVRALDNEAQLAAVLAHEAAHASLGHLWADAAESAFLRRCGRLDAEAMSRPEFAALLAGLLEEALARGLPQEREHDADLAAVAMLFRAGYDPGQLPRAISAIAEAERRLHRAAPPMGWTALHPPVKRRLALIGKLLVTLPGGGGLALGTERYRAMAGR